MDREYDLYHEDDDDFSPMSHDLDEYHADLCEEFADEFENNNDKSEV